MSKIELKDETIDLGLVSVVNMPEGFKITEIFLHNPLSSIELDINPFGHVVLEKENTNKLTEYIFVQDINADIWCHNYIIPLEKLEDWETWLHSPDTIYESDNPPSYCICIDDKKLIFSNYRLDK